MLDLLIHGAQVVTPEEVGQLDVAVAGGRVAGLGAAGTFGQEQAFNFLEIQPCHE